MPCTCGHSSENAHTTNHTYGAEGKQSSREDDISDGKYVADMLRPGEYNISARGITTADSGLIGEGF